MAPPSAKVFLVSAIFDFMTDFQNAEGDFGPVIGDHTSIDDPLLDIVNIGTARYRPQFAHT